MTIIRKIKLGDPEPNDWVETTPEQRLEAVWQLTRAAYAFKGEDPGDTRFLVVLCALSDARAEYLLVGAHARAIYGTPQATGDMDLWVRRTPDNAARVMRALVALGAPLHELSEADWLQPEVVFQIGIAPYRIDLLTDVSGVSFDDAWSRRTTVHIHGVAVPVIGRDDYLANKRATGRLKDLADIEDVESA